MLTMQEEIYVLSVSQTLTNKLSVIIPHYQQRNGFENHYLSKY